jgi:hypothetical protein
MIARGTAGGSATQPVKFRRIAGELSALRASRTVLVA